MIVKIPRESFFYLISMIYFDVCNSTFIPPNYDCLTLNC